MPDRRASVAVGVACGVSSAVAGLFLAAPARTGDIVGLTPQPPGFPWGSTTTASAWGLLAALAICVGARRVADALFPGAIAAIVLLVVGISSSPPTLLTAVAAGVLLGAALQLSRVVHTRAAAVTPVLGAVAGILTAPMLAQLRRGLPGGNGRYADYVPSSTQLMTLGTDVVDFGAVVVGVVAMIVILVCLARRWRDQIGGSARRSVIGATALIVGCALVHWWFLRFIADSLQDETRTGLHTFYGGYVLLGLAVVAALGLPGVSGLLWLGAAASTIAVATDGTNSSGALVAITTVVLVIVATVLTVTVIRRSPPDQQTRGVPIAVAILTVFTATRLLGDSAIGIVPILVGPFGVPVVVAMTLAAAVVAGRPDPATVVGAFALLALTRLTTGSSFGWTSYTPLTDGLSFDGVTGNPPTTGQTVVAVIALIACFAVAAVLARRPGADPSVP